MSANPAEAISPSSEETTPRIDPNRFYRPLEVARLLGCSLTNVYDLMLKGKLARTKIGAGRSGYRVRGSAIVEFIEAQTEGGPQPQMNFKFLRMNKK
jgi:excisionase family DNA binding protein